MVKAFVGWCEPSFLEINVSKTRETLSDVRKKIAPHLLQLPQPTRGRLRRNLTNQVTLSLTTAEPAASPPQRLIDFGWRRAASHRSSVGVRQSTAPLHGSDVTEVRQEPLAQNSVPDRIRRTEPVHLQSTGTIRRLSEAVSSSIRPETGRNT
ncbi:hypothetical protein CRENBAI_011983, partial [Crenichthys baileyi]